MDDPATCVDCAPDDLQAPLAKDPTPASKTEEEPKQYNVLDPATFVAPSHPIPHSITIEFCNRCRWLHRASWTSTELMLTFPPPAINAISLMPLDSEETGGRFRVWLYHSKDKDVASAIEPMLVWDRKIEGGFPEMKVLKQRVRDLIEPGKSLGHSDKDGHSAST